MHFCYAFRYTELGGYLKSKGADDALLNHYGLDCYSGLEPLSPDLRNGGRSVTFSADTKGSKFAAHLLDVDDNAVQSAVAGVEEEEEREEILKAQMELSFTRHNADILGLSVGAFAPSPGEGGEAGGSGGYWADGGGVAAAAPQYHGIASVGDCTSTAGQRQHCGFGQSASCGGESGGGGESELPASRSDDTPTHTRAGFTATRWLDQDGQPFGEGAVGASEEGREVNHSWPPLKGRQPFVRPPTIVARAASPLPSGERDDGLKGVIANRQGGGRETVVISAHEFQRLKALATPSAASVRVVGDKAVLLATEYSRLSEAAFMMQGHVTPSSTKVSSSTKAPGGAGFAERARAARRLPSSVSLDPIADSPNRSDAGDAHNTSRDSRSHDLSHASWSHDLLSHDASGYSSGGSRRGGRGDSLNISSDHSSPFSSLSRESPAVASSSFANSLSPWNGEGQGIDLLNVLGEIDENDEGGGVWGLAMSHLLDPWCGSWKGGVGRATVLRDSGGQTKCRPPILGRFLSLHRWTRKGG